jgi:hypothetical protein
VNGKYLKYKKIFFLILKFLFLIIKVVVWLEKNVKLIIDESRNLNKSINDYKNRFKTLFAKIPPNVLRHVILSDSKEMVLNLPPVLKKKSVLKKKFLFVY